jgi:hypothetical protein
MFEFCIKDEPLRRYTLDTSVIKCCGVVGMVTWRWNNFVALRTMAKCRQKYIAHVVHWKQCQIVPFVDPVSYCNTCPHAHGNIAVSFCYGRVECSPATALPRYKIRTFEAGNTWFATTLTSLLFSVFCQVTEFTCDPGRVGHAHRSWWLIS